MTQQNLCFADPRDSGLAVFTCFKTFHTYLFIFILVYFFSCALQLSLAYHSFLSSMLLFILYGVSSALAHLSYILFQFNFQSTYPINYSRNTTICCFLF
ncbi:hypothetical protein DFH28DRAFT_965276, partial [Melampsora americana]